MNLLLLLGFMAIGYLTEYVVAVYATAVFLDPDDIAKAVSPENGYQKHLISALRDDPRALTQILALYRSLVLMTNTTLGITSLHSLDTDSSFPWFFYPPVLLVVWVAHLFSVEYLPRRSSRKLLAGTLPHHFWIVAAIHAALSPLLKLYRRVLASAGSEQPVTEEQKDELVERALENMADQAGIAEPLIEKDEKEMIGGILELDQTVVREIMVPRIDMEALPRHATLDEVRAVAAKSGHSRFPVYDGSLDKIIGILYVKDLFSRGTAAGGTGLIEAHLRQPLVVPETKVIGALLREFRQQKVHLAIVADEYGGTAGLITLEDILEEIVGEIQDEHDAEEGSFLPQPDGSILIDAALLVDDFQREVGTEFVHDGEIDTMGGLVYAIVGSVPTQGQVVSWHSHKFRIEEVQGQRIVKIRLLQAPQVSLKP